MISRPRLAVGGCLSAILVSIVACGGGTATTEPTATPTAAPTSAATTLSIATVPPGPGTTAGTGALDPSTIVTTEMAASIIGGTVTKTDSPLGGPGMGVVLYSNAAGDSITVLVEQVPPGVGNAILQAAIQTAGAPGTLEAISGLGDVAGKAVTSNEATVAFVKGANLVLIAATSSTVTGAALEPKVESVAQQVAGRL